MADTKPTVFVVDDEVCVRESLELLIDSAGWRPVTFASGHDFLSRPRALIPSCLVLDVNLPDIHGLDVQKRVARDRTDMPIIFITGRGDIPTTVQAMKAGAVEFLTKPVNTNDLLSAIEQAIERSRTTLGEEEEMRQLRDRLSSLTPREREVMELVASGRLNKQAGGELGISEITVKAHRGQMMRKMKALSLAHLVKMAEKLRLASTRTDVSSSSVLQRAPGLGVSAQTIEPNERRSLSASLEQRHAGRIPRGNKVKRQSTSSSGPA
jgi:FixJ family two-component response regulator